MAYQGVFASDALASLGLPWHLGAQAALEFDGNLSYLKGGVPSSEPVNTVSPTYAHEIQGREHGFGFEGVLQTRASDLSGILNGVDYDEWDPGVDPRIARTIRPRTSRARRPARPTCCAPSACPKFPDLPVVGITSRLVWQKGFDLVAGAWCDLLQRQTRMVVLGTGEPSVQEGLRGLEQEGLRPVRYEFSLRRGAGPQGHGRLRHLPDAVAERALAA